MGHSNMTSPYLENIIKKIADDGARPYHKQFALERLATVIKTLRDEIDGGDECKARDGWLSDMIADLEYVERQVGAIK